MRVGLFEPRSSIMGVDPSMALFPGLEARALAQKALQSSSGATGLEGLGEDFGTKLITSLLLALATGIYAGIGIFVFRHVDDEKSGFWRAVGYIGGSLMVLGALGSLAGAVTVPFLTTKKT